MESSSHINVWPLVSFFQSYFLIHHSDGHRLKVNDFSLVSHLLFSPLRLAFWFLPKYMYTPKEDIKWTSWGFMVTHLGQAREQNLLALHYMAIIGSWFASRQVCLFPELHSTPSSYTDFCLSTSFHSNVLPIRSILSANVWASAICILRFATLLSSMGNTFASSPNPDLIFRLSSGDSVDPIKFVKQSIREPDLWPLLPSQHQVLHVPLK